MYKTTGKHRTTCASGTRPRSGRVFWHPTAKWKDSADGESSTAEFEKVETDTETSSDVEKILTDLAKDERNHDLQWHPDTQTPQEDEGEGRASPARANNEVPSVRVGECPTEGARVGAWVTLYDWQEGWDLAWTIIHELMHQANADDAYNAAMAAAKKEWAEQHLDESGGTPKPPADEVAKWEAAARGDYAEEKYREEGTGKHGGSGAVDRENRARAAVGDSTRRGHAHHVRSEGPRRKGG